MARVSRITLAQRFITDYFHQLGRSAFSQKELFDIISDKRDTWDLPATSTEARIVEKLIRNNFLREAKLTLSNGTESSIYLFEIPSIYEIAVALRPKSFISHFSAVYLHGLTNQVPKTVYSSIEQSRKILQDVPTLNQSSIDRAFSAPQRRSHLHTTYLDYTILLVSSKHSNRAGIKLSTRHPQSHFSYTTLERTLIDIAVRPNYAGGAQQVLSTYEAAVAQGNISTNKLLSTLEASDYIYPYHQAIGFYLERAGYQGKLLEALRQIPRRFKFYLDYDMPDPEYDTIWKIWHPKGL